MIEHFVELRKYIDHSHDGLSKRLEKVEARLGKVETGQGRLEGAQERLVRKVDAGFNRLGRKTDALASARRVTPRRRKP